MFNTTYIRGQLKTFLAENRNKETKEFVIENERLYSLGPSLLKTSAMEDIIKNFSLAQDKTPSEWIT